jgi:hypothetical protein
LWLSAFVSRWLSAFVPLFFAGFGTSPCKGGAAGILSGY